MDDQPSSSSAATNYRSKNEPDGSVTKWESRDGGKSWAMVEQTYPTKPLDLARLWLIALPPKKGSKK